jgi:AcrR family transcriptional regulator
MAAGITKGKQVEGRGVRRRRETRAKLIRAAHTVMARKGIDATTLQEITEAADVAFGSFYNHFESKEAIVEAIIAEIIESFGDAVERITESVDDPLEVLAASVRYVVGKAVDDETWGWFLIRSGLSMPIFRVALMQRMARDIELAIDSGRCDVDDVDSTVLAAAGTVMAIMTARLRGELVKDAPERAATIILRLLGLPAKEAQELAHRPLPESRRQKAGGGVR